MHQGPDRRRFLALAGLGGVVFSSGLGFAAAGVTDFHFVQLTDTHWGYAGPANPEAATTLKRAVAAVNALAAPPDFVVFTGDLTHNTEDAAERRRRLAEFRGIVDGLTVKTRYFLPGEHDAALDRGVAYAELFGPLHYSFDHKGIHFVALDNVSDPAARLGEDQLAWLAADLKAVPADRPVVVFAHRPLFDLYPDWDWTTQDGRAAIDILQTRAEIAVFYGHIHQEHHHMTGHVAHHAATSLIFPQPAPGSQPRRSPVAWDPAAPFKGLGWRDVAAGTTLGLTEKPLA